LCLKQYYCANICLGAYHERDKVVANYISIPNIERDVCTIWQSNKSYDTPAHMSLNLEWLYLELAPDNEEILSKLVLVFNVHVDTLLSP